MARTKKPRVYPASVPLEKVLREHRQEQEFDRAYRELESEFEIVQQIIDLRLKRGVTQEELAKRLGTQQSSVARLESRRQTKDLDFLRRVAQALDARLEVRLVPQEKHAGPKQKRRKLKV